jgi:hypothetical protein
MVPADVVFNSFLAGGYYFNVHSETFPGGEIRGQIEPLEPAESVPEPAMVLGMLTVGALGLAFRSKKRQDELKVSRDYALLTTVAVAISITKAF